MKSCLFIILFVTFTITVIFAQKKLIDSTTYGSWETIGAREISSNGKYVLYQYGAPKTGYRIILQETGVKNQQKLLYRGRDEKSFAISTDSKYVVVTSAHDSLLLLTVTSGKIRHFSEITSFKMMPANKRQRLAYLKQGNLKIMDLGTGKEITIEDVTAFWYNAQNTTLVVKAKDALSWVDMDTGKITKFFQGKGIVGAVLDASGMRVAFLVTENEKEQSHNYICSAEKGKSTYNIRATDTLRGVGKELFIADNLPFFNKAGSRLFFFLEKKRQLLNKKNGTAEVDVWNYRDEKLQSEQLERLNYRQQYLAVSNEGEKGFIQLQEEKDEWPVYSKPDEYFLTEQTEFKSDYWWHEKFTHSFYLVSAKDGSRKAIVDKTTQEFSSFRLSTGGHFITWFNEVTKQYNSYEMATGITRTDITKGIAVPVYQKDGTSREQRGAFGIAGWLENDTAVLVYDRYDIWQVDPLGINKPLNITHGYGREHQIVFRSPDGDWLRDAGITSDKILLLSSFDQKTKQNGFYKAKLDGGSAPERCTMGPYVYAIPYQSNPGIIGMDPGGVAPIKAANADIFLVQQMSATAAPNLFVTKDFKSFQQLTDIQPQKEYNWLTSELVSWKMLDGKPSEGILYKPENFDSSKKYPLIFYYYEQKSAELNTFRQPEARSTVIIDIPTYVSNGYLVFEPDIHYHTGYIGDGAVNAVVSAAKYLSKLPYVDSTKMGLQGHSFGGFQTNYLVTHSNLFAAACEGAGASDVISFYGKLSLQGSSNIAKMESAQTNIGNSLYEKPELYVHNSPVFLSNQVTTPLLIMHNKTDGAVPFEQGVEMFLNLRRAGKKVWLLQYDNEGEGHALNNRDNQRDFGIRMRQFFDHYLKDAPPPKWMTEGVPARLKGVEDGLELDTSGKQP